MTTRGEWSKVFLNALGNQNPTDSTVNYVSAWTAGEGTRARYNPLATTLDYGENTPFNYINGRPGVRNYMSRQQGIEATIKTLQGNHPGYADIMAGLLANDPQKASDGLIAAPWGTNGSHVEQMWRSTDLRGQILIAEPINPGERDTEPPAGPPQGGFGPPNAGSNPSMRGGGGSDQSAPPDSGENPNLDYEPGLVLSAAKVGLGVTLLVIAFVLVVRTYIPTQQIVKAVETAAVVA